MFFEYLVVGNSVIANTFFCSFNDTDRAILNQIQLEPGSDKYHVFHIRADITDAKFHAVVGLSFLSILAQSGLYQLVKALHQFRYLTTGDI